MISLCRTTKNILVLKDLSIEAKAVLLFMLYDELKLDHVKAITDHLSLGRTKAYRILDELIENGYVKRYERDECRYKPLKLTHKTLKVAR